MNANIYRHEFRARLRSVLIWSLAVATLIGFFSSLFSSFADQAALVNDLMARFPPELLAATPEIDADHPELRRLAAEAVGAEKGVHASSARLVRWVHDRLAKVYGQSRDKASEVLAAGKGDCTEHALLFVAMARAAGIPARGVHGLVYAAYGDGVHALYWHAWAEVRAGEEWIAVDPTFGQPVADATHVALGRGMRVDAVGLLGGLSVVSAEPMGAP